MSANLAALAQEAEETTEPENELLLELSECMAQFEERAENLEFYEDDSGVAYIRSPNSIEMAVKFDMLSKASEVIEQADNIDWSGLELQHRPTRDTTDRVFMD